MNPETSKVPNIQIENIGSRKKPLYVIKGFVELNSWTGYYLYDDSYKLIKDKVVTNGRIGLWVDGEITPNGEFRLSQEQVNSYFYLVEHQEIIKHSILETLKKEFPRLLSEEYASWDAEEDFFPKPSELTQAFDFKDYIGPESIRIGEDVKAGIAYITWSFRCRWDIEHGFEVITHKDRVIDIAPEADPWKIDQDNGTFEQKQKEYNVSILQLPKKKKRWWQFW
jgi:hypothetical protein